MNSLKSDEEIEKIKINVDERKRKRLEALKTLIGGGDKTATLQTLKTLFEMGW